QAVEDEGLYDVINRMPVNAWTRKTTLSAEPKTYRQRAPPGIGSSSATLTRSRYPVRSWSQSASCLNKGDLLLALGPESLESHPDLRVLPGGQLDVEAVHRAGWDPIRGRPVEVERAGVAGTDEAGPVGLAVDGTSQVGALGLQRDDRRRRAGRLTD